MTNPFWLNFNQPSITPVILSIPAMDEQELRGINLIYETANDTTDAVLPDGDMGKSAFIGQYLSAMFSYYHVYRRALVFDTSALGPITITDVKLRLHCYDRDITGSDFDVVVQRDPAYVYPHDPIQTIDIDKTKYTETGNSKAASTFNVGNDPLGWNEIAIDPSWINTSTVTGLILRSSRDISVTAPSADPNNELLFLTIEETKTELLITYL